MMPGSFGGWPGAGGSSTLGGPFGVGSPSGPFRTGGSFIGGLLVGLFTGGGAGSPRDGARGSEVIEHVDASAMPAMHGLAGA